MLAHFTGVSLMTRACPSPERLMQLACERTGLSDFGDPARHAGLRAYMTGVGAERWPSMIEGARVAAVEYFVHLLSLRLRLIANRHQYPGIAGDEIVAPMIIIGPPRSGSTLLHTLLNQDPDNRAVEHWVCLEPSPNYIQDRRENPRSDMMTQLAQAKYRDGELPDIADIVSHAAVLFGAGQDTTVRLVAALLKTLAENADLQAQVRADRSLIPAVVEEVLRLDGPTKTHFRLAKRHVKVGDLDVAPGTVIMLVQSAMRRDPRVFESPNEFRLDRNNLQTQLAFGKGIHTCIGAALARAEARLAVEHILDRVSDLRINEAKHGVASKRHYEYEPNYTQRALCEVHLEFTKK